MQFHTMQCLWLPGLVLVPLALAGCPATSKDVRPADDQFAFPAGLDVSPDERFLFVTNANSELRFDSGTLEIVDLAVVDAIATEWLASGQVPADPDGCEDCCEVDATFSHTLICNEQAVIRADSTVRLGNFATDVRTQTLDSGALRLFVPVRGDPSITWVDFSPEDEVLDCGGQGSFPRCDEEHRLTQMREDLTLPTLADEPFGIYVDSGNGFAMVTHLSSGIITLLDTPTNGTAPTLVDALGGLFAANVNTGIRGAVGVAGRLPGTPNSLVYVTSRAESRVQTLFVQRAPGGLPTLVPSEYFFLNRVVPSDDGRGIAFSPDGTRAHAINRDPPMLQTIDTSLGPDGFPRNELASTTEICAQAAAVVLADPGRGERAYVSCFRDGQVWVVDTDSSIVEAIIDVGRGPHSLATSADKQHLYVANFLEDTIAVIDIEPGSSTENRVILQLGRERLSGGE